MMVTKKKQAGALSLADAEVIAEEVRAFVDRREAAIEAKLDKKFAEHLKEVQRIHTAPKMLIMDAAGKPIGVKTVLPE